jgi:hypothetical protein
VTTKKTRPRAPTRESGPFPKFVDWEADAVAIWFARHFPMMPATLAAVLAVLASLGRAFQ